MTPRRLAALLLIAAPFLFVALEGRRCLLGWLLWRNDFTRLERWDDGTCFFPAVRKAERLRSRSPGLSPMVEWASRRFRARFPGETVRDVRLLGSDEMLVLLSRPHGPNDENPVDGRLIVLEAGGRQRAVAESDPFDFNPRSVEVSAGEDARQPLLLARGGGCGEVGLLFRREGPRLLLVPCAGTRETEPYFLCWTGLAFEDVDGDGIPEVRGLQGKGACCPACGREAEANRTTWKLDGDRTLPWTIRGEDCGPACERPWLP
jgi:hypothetical protein